MDKSDRRLIAQGAFAAVALTMAGFFVGAKRLVWGLWFLVSAVWVLVWLGAMANNPNEKAILYILTAFVPPAVLLFVIRILAAIVDGIIGVSREVSRATSAEASSKPLEVEQLGQGKP